MPGNTASNSGNAKHRQANTQRQGYGADGDEGGCGHGCPKGSASAFIDSFIKGSIHFF